MNNTWLTAACWQWQYVFDMTVIYVSKISTKIMYSQQMVCILLQKGSFILICFFVMKTGRVLVIILARMNLNFVILYAHCAHSLVFI